MKQAAIAIVALMLSAAAFAFWVKSPGVEGDTGGRSEGSSTGFILLAPEITTTSMTAVLEQNGFVKVEGMTFDSVCPAGDVRPEYGGLALFRDTSSSAPNELYVGLGDKAGKNTIFYHEAHSGSTEVVARWREHVEKQRELIISSARKPPPAR